MSEQSWNEGFQTIFEIDCEAIPGDPDDVPADRLLRPSTEAILGAIHDLIERAVLQIEEGDNKASRPTNSQATALKVTNGSSHPNEAKRPITADP